MAVHLVVTNNECSRIYDSSQMNCFLLFIFEGLTYVDTLGAKAIICVITWSVECFNSVHVT